MIALFDGVFPRVSIRRDLGFGSEGLLMGFKENAQGFSALLILEDGRVMLVDVDKVTLAYRYDVEADRWIDSSVPEGSEPDQR